MTIRKRYETTRTALAVVAAVLAAAMLLAGCGSSSGSRLVKGKTNVVTSFYPLYYLAKEIGGSRVNAVNLVPAGVEPHDWSPKSRDLDTASKAQLFLYNGAGLEGWVSDFLQGLPGDSKLVTLEASKAIKLIPGDPEGGGATVDPHTWVSPKSMIVMAGTVLSALQQADPSHKADYQANHDKLRAKLAALDADYEKTLSGAKNKNIVVSHQAFGYLARDYGLNQVAIMGLSPDAEPKAQDMMKIASFVKKNGIKYIFFESLVSDELAKTLAREAGVDTLVLNPVEGLTPEQEKRGDDYVSLMRANLQNLIQALQ